MIVGAGLTGLIAAHAWPQALVVEAVSGPTGSHHALLRFRSDAVARLTGVEFRRVTVRKGIWSCGTFQEPNLRLANLYARKVLGERRLTAERSIWRVDAAERFIAPDDLYEQLVDAVGDRIVWGEPYTPTRRDAAWVVSTAPLPVMLELCPLDGVEDLDAQFCRTAIRVRRWRAPRVDLFQTVYFPDPETPLYRASITGSLLIVEEVIRFGLAEPEPLRWIEDAFGLDVADMDPLDDAQQSYGKVDPLPDDLRKRLLYGLTTQHGIYSLGRFATWRNILLDDVVNDIAVIKRLMRMTVPYDLHRAVVL